MTTNGINNINRLEQAGIQTDGNKIEKAKNTARKKDIVEISRKDNMSVNQDVTYSKESVKRSTAQLQNAENTESVHNLNEIKEKIDQGHYNSDEVIDTVVNRIIDQLD